MDFNIADPPSNLFPSFSSSPRGLILNNFAVNVTVAEFGDGEPSSVARCSSSHVEVEDVDNYVVEYIGGARDPVVENSVVEYTGWMRNKVVENSCITYEIQLKSRS